MLATLESNKSDHHSQDLEEKNVNERESEEPFFIDDQYKIQLENGEEEEEDKPEHLKVFNYDTLLSDTSKMYQLKNYFVGASNGFVRLYTAEGHRYWLAQAICQHRSPDMKIHFSIHLDDLPKAFELLAQHFYLSRCKFGMKAYMLKDWIHRRAQQEFYEDEVLSVEDHDLLSDLSVERNSVESSILLDVKNSDTLNSSDISSVSIDSGWPEHMQGREITVYIYRYYDLEKYKIIREYGEGGIFKEFSVDDSSCRYRRLDLTEYCHGNPFAMFDLQKKHEEPLVFYRKWIQVAEEILEKNGIRNNGCAFGDLNLGGKYASFRNETFIPLRSREKELLENLKENQSLSVDDLFVYPLNENGWNASGFPDSQLVYEALRFNQVKLYDYTKWFGI